MGVYDLSYLPTPGVMPGANLNQMATQNYMQQAPMGSYGSPAGSSMVSPVAPSMGGNMGPATGLGMNLGTGQLLLGGLGAIGNFWTAFQAQKQAKEQFNFQKGITNTNLANQIQSYNTTLSDKINSRIAQEGGDPSEAKTYIENNKLTDERNKA